LWWRHIFYFHNRLPADIRYVERITGLQLPKAVSDIQISRPREFCVSGKMHLPGADTNFIKINGFTLSTNFFLNGDLGIDKDLFSLPKTNF
jgi:hypothetical protein